MVARTHPDPLVLCAGGEEAPVGAEAHTADVEVPRLARGVVRQHAVARVNSSINIFVRDSPNPPPRLHIVYLRRPITPRREVLSVAGELDAAHNPAARIQMKEHEDEWRQRTSRG